MEKPKIKQGDHGKQVKNGKQRQSWAYHAKKLKKSKCETCGTKKKLHIHHMDRDWANNEPSNLQTLCASCHLKWHHEHDHILPEYTYPSCRICGAPYKRNSRGDLCSTHRANLLKYGTEIIPKTEHSPCRICGAPYKPGRSRGDLCGNCRKTHKTIKKECLTCGTKIWASKEYCFRHAKDAVN